MIYFAKSSNILIFSDMPFDIHVFVHLGHYFLHHYVHLIIWHSWCLNVLHSITLSESSCLISCYLPFNIVSIAFIPNQEQTNMLWSVALNADYPILDISEWLSFGQVKYDDNAIGRFVESLRDGFESLLACCIKYLHWYSFLVRCNVGSCDKV